jgi:hypothetical protein
LNSGCGARNKWNSKTIWKLRFYPTMSVSF